MDCMFKTDIALKKLIFPLSADDYMKLEESILAEGCREPICIWQGKLLTGIIDMKFA